MFYPSAGTGADHWVAEDLTWDARAMVRRTRAVLRAFRCCRQDGFAVCAFLGGGRDGVFRVGSGAPPRLRGAPCFAARALRC
jgi:hypothetical protein